MSNGKTTRKVQKPTTGCSDFDVPSQPARPKGSGQATGIAGSAQSVLAARILAENIAQANGGCVFVTFDERPADIRSTMLDLGLDIRAWEDEGKWAFVDATLRPGEERLETGSYDLGGLLARLEHAVKRVDARLVVIDSLAAVFGRFQAVSLVWSELLRICSRLRDMNVTPVMTVGRPETCNASSSCARRKATGSRLAPVSSASKERKETAKARSSARARRRRLSRATSSG